MKASAENYLYAVALLDKLQ